MIPTYLYKGNPYTDKTVSLDWDGTLGLTINISSYQYIQKPNHYLFDEREGVCRFQRWTKSLTFMWDTFTHPCPHSFNE